MATALLSPTPLQMADTRSRSSLNPHAPTFLPAAFLQAEDFSPQWWCLIHTCPAFRDHWLHEYCSIEADLLRQHDNDDASVLADFEHASMELKQDLENVPFLSSDKKLDLDLLVLKQTKPKEVRAYRPSKPAMPPKTVARSQKSSVRKIIQQPR